MEITIFPRWSMTETVWRTVILSLIGSLLVLMVFSLSRGITTIFMHLFYFPVVLMAYHYHRKGILYTGIFCILYVALFYFFTYPDLMQEQSAVIHAIVFLCIALVVALLSENLERQKAQYVAVFRSAEEALMRVDLNSLSVVEVNPRLCEMLGFRPDDVKGSHLDRFWPDDMARRDFIRQLSVNKPVRSRESTVIAQDGSVHNVIVSAGILPGKNAIFTMTDVSGQKQEEKRMQALMQLHESIIMNANVWLMVLDPAGKVLIWNKAAEDISGYRSDEVVGTTKIWKWIYPDREYRKKITADIVNIIQTNNFFENLETTIRCRDGQERVISWNTRGLTDKAGAAVQFIAIGRDITSLKRAQEALRKSEERLRTIIHSLQLGIVIIDEQTHIILDANKKALEMIGAGTDVIVGSVCHRFICPAESGRCPVTDLGQKVDSSERVLITLQGEKIPILKTVITTNLGGKKVLIESFIDITERKQAEKVLRESEDKYRRFFSTSHDCVFITSADGRWVDLNDAAVELFGYASRDELMRVKIQDLYSDPDRRKEHIRIILETGFSKEYPVDLLKKDGTIMHTLVTTVARKDEAGNVIGFQGTVRDITELKRAEEALIFAGKKLNLLNSITRHDILNQLMALDVFIQLSEDMTNDPAMRELLDKEARISAVIARQIAFTKDYQELGVKAPGWQSVHASIRSAAGALLIRDVRIDVDCTDLEVFADPLFEKVFYNLIDNALRYGGDRMTTIRVSSHDTGAGLVIAFADNGAGISADDKKHLFERGFGKNTGLGLFLVREILSITGLSIAETGEPGRGARFEISVPKGVFRFRRNSGNGPKEPGKSGTNPS
jgi:PAS domain S-box-containing protein